MNEWMNEIDEIDDWYDIQEGLSYNQSSRSNEVKDERNDQSIEEGSGEERRGRGSSDPLLCICWVNLNFRYVSSLRRIAPV